jgi:hypothetical protein
MTRDETYEKAVSVLENKYAKEIAAVARRAVEREEDDVFAADLVSTYLLNDLEWEKVEAKDISDIAYDACVEARRAG